MKICIDPGHGGKDPGAVGPGGTKEKDVVLAVAKYLKQELSAIAQVTLTRTTDQYVELSERAALANNLGVDYFISVHCNSATNQTAKGTETLVYALGGEAEKLAKTVQARLIDVLKTSDRGVKTRNVYVLRKTKMPAILVELAFISNPEEEKLLTNSVWQQKAAQTIAKGVANYLGINLEGDDEGVQKTKVIYKDNELDGFVKDGKSFVEVKKLCEIFGKKVSWNSKKQIVEVKD